jgi:hypothetical protein
VDCEPAIAIVEVGDLIRWVKPLYYIQDGREYTLENWNYALVVEVKTNVYSSMIIRNLTLQLMGQHSQMRIDISLDMLTDLGKIEKLCERKWICID